MSPRTVAAAAPPRVRERLGASPDGPVPILHRGPHALYVAVGGACVGVVSADAVQVPCALRLASRDLTGLDDRSARMADGLLHLGDTALRVGRTVDVRVPSRPTRGRVDQDLGLRLVADVGRGPGLTPEADDVLAGWLAIHRSMGMPTERVDAAVRIASTRTTLLSATLLGCALDGEVVPQLAAYVAALDTPDELARASDLTSLGHTSGAALLHGALLGWAHHHPARRSAA